VCVIWSAQACFGAALIPEAQDLGLVFWVACDGSQQPAVN